LHSQSEEALSTLERAAALCPRDRVSIPYAVFGRSYVDLDRGIFYRKAIGKRTTKKRQTPAPIPPRLLAHLRRW
jgi:hypothetical protein